MGCSEERRNRMTLKEQFVKEHPEHVFTYNRYKIADKDNYLLWLEEKLLIALKDIEELKKRGGNMEQVFVFVYSRDKKVKVLNIEEAKILNDSLINEGWKHTQTLNACAWIQYLCNDCEDLRDEVMAFIS